MTNLNSTWILNVNFLPSTELITTRTKLWAQSVEGWTRQRSSSMPVVRPKGDEWEETCWLLRKDEVEGNVCSKKNFTQGVNIKTVDKMLREKSYFWDGRNCWWRSIDQRRPREKKKKNVFKVFAITINDNENHKLTIQKEMKSLLNKLTRLLL